MEYGFMENPDLNEPNRLLRNNSMDKKNHTLAKPPNIKPNVNITRNILNRQIYGRFTKHPRAKTERLFNKVHNQCKFALNSMFTEFQLRNHIFMGFTICGQYFISYTERMDEDYAMRNSGYLGVGLYPYIYELYIWRFVPGFRLNYVAKHRIFKHHNGSDLETVLVMQYPNDSQKIVCYGISAANTDYISILTLPSPKSCRHCTGLLQPNDESINTGWCSKHGFIIHFMFSMSNPTPQFVPKISLAFPNHLIINTGHYIHILNINTSEPNTSNLINLIPSLKATEASSQSSLQFNDSLSEVSESPSEHSGTASIADAILEDFNEYDLESGDCNKPFHELNISCEPLNVTGKSYHNALVQNIVDPRLKRLQQNSTEKSKIAEKAYEFIEENEKCEKLSSFRKKRLAEKKYEFSEDNSENIVPFNSLRRDRKYFSRTQSRCIRSPDYNSIFLSPNSRNNGQFSPGGARNVYCTSIRNSPHHSKSPISPKESARKFYVYSPSLESDCSDSDSRLIMRVNGLNNFMDTFSHVNSNGLLIVAPKSESPKWIKKLVRRYTNGDFENSSLLSGQSRDDYNIPIEIPIMVQNLTDQHFDVVPEFKADNVNEMQLIVSQRSFDCEQFVQRRSQILCTEAHLQYLHCVDYDIKVIHVCPLSGLMVAKALIKIGALRNTGPSQYRPDTFIAQVLFTWNILTDAFDLIESKENRILPLLEYNNDFEVTNIPFINCADVVVMEYNCSGSKQTLRDYNNYYEVSIGKIEYFETLLTSSEESQESL